MQTHLLLPYLAKLLIVDVWIVLLQFISIFLITKTRFLLLSFALGRIEIAACLQLTHLEYWANVEPSTIPGRSELLPPTLHGRQSCCCHTSPLTVVPMAPREALALLSCSTRLYSAPMILAASSVRPVCEESYLAEGSHLARSYLASHHHWSQAVQHIMGQKTRAFLVACRGVGCHSLPSLFVPFYHQR